MTHSHFAPFHDERFLLKKTLEEEEYPEEPNLKYEGSGRRFASQQPTIRKLPLRERTNKMGEQGWCTI
jgi:hypothetical protein